MKIEESVDQVSSEDDIQVKQSSKNDSDDISSVKDIITDEEDEIEEMMRHVDGTGE